MHAFLRLILRIGAGFLAVSTALAGPIEEPFLELEIPDAFARAEAQNKLVLMFFHSEAEPESRRMVRITFADPEVRKWIAENTIPIQLDALEDRALLSRFGVARMPMVQMRTADKRMLEQIQFYHSPENFLASAKATLAGRSITSRPEGAAANDPYSWLAWGNYLFNNEGDPDEMVRAYWWCLTNGDTKEPGFRSRYFDFLLKRVSYAKRVSSLAATRMVAEQKRLSGLIFGGTATDQTAYELVRINFWLRREEDTRQLFVDMQESDASLASMRTILMYHELDGLMAHGKYSEVLKHLPDPGKEIQRRKLRMEQAAERATKAETGIQLGQVVIGLDESRSQWVFDASLFYEALLHEGRGKDAADLLDLVVTEVPTGRAYALFMDKTTRLGLKELSRKTGARGLEAVKGKSAKKIRTAIMKIDGGTPEADANLQKKLKAAREKAGDEGGDQ